MYCEVPDEDAWIDFMDSVRSLVSLSAEESLLQYLDRHCSSCQLRQHCILTERSSQQYSLPIRGWQYSSQYSLPTSRLQGLQGGQGLGFQGFPGWQGLGFQDFKAGRALGFKIFKAGRALGFNVVKAGRALETVATTFLQARPRSWPRWRPR